MSAAFPGFLVAGSVFALLPLVLHLLSRRPPHRQPLPTARFLREDRRTLLRMSTRPSDVPVLVVRTLFALALGAAFAGVTWSAERSGEAALILVDVEAAADVGLDSLLTAVQHARSTIGDVREVRVVAYARDDAGRLRTAVDPVELVEAIGAPTTTAADAFGALRAAFAEDGSFESATARWVFQPTWRQWATGVGLTREAYWPGGLTLHPLGGTGARADEPTSEVPALSAISPGFPPGAPLRRALTALGIRLDPESDDETPDLIVARDVSARDLSTFSQAARQGTTVVLSGTFPPDSDPAVPWDLEASPESRSLGAEGTPAIYRRGRPPLRLSAPVTGGPTDGASVVTVSDTGRPLAAARRVGEGCLVFTAVALDDDVLTASAGFVDFVDELLSACATPASDRPLDRGALDVLARTDLPTRVRLSELGHQGTPLTPWFIVFTLVLLVAEVFLTRRRTP